jgi:hypothetical protein
MQPSHGASLWLADVSGRVAGSILAAILGYLLDSNGTTWLWFCKCLVLKFLACEVQQYIRVDGPADTEISKMIDAAIPICFYIATSFLLYNADAVRLLIWDLLLFVGGSGSGSRSSSSISISIFVTGCCAAATTLACFFLVDRPWQKLWIGFVKWRAINRQVKAYRNSAFWYVVRFLGFGWTWFVRGPAGQKLLQAMYGRRVSTGWKQFCFSNTKLDGEKVFFKHRKLQKDSREFRLLKLHRRMPLAPVLCTLVELSVDDNHDHPYEAISYVWGNDEQKSREIILNGLPFPVSSVVHDILEGHSSSFKTRFLWIDSICIDQTDLKERSEQVRLMRDIYHGTERVVVWLGHSDDAQLMPRLLTLLKGLIFMNNFSDADLCKFFDGQTKSPSWLALVKLYQNPWFRRVWVIQEIAVATKVHVIYGGRYLDWMELVYTMSAFLEPEMSTLLLTTENVRDKRELILALRSAQQMERYRDELHMKNPLSLQEVILGCSTSLATDPRDKVYGLLGIATDLDPLDESLFPDYDKSVEEVYTAIARHFLSKDDDADADALHILPLAGIGHSRTLQHLPSWVPDFSGEPRTNPFAHTENGNGLKYRASGTSKPQIHSAPDDLEEIVLGGMYIDEIHQLGDLIHSLEEPSDTADLYHVISQVMKLASWHHEAHDLALARQNSNLKDHDYCYYPNGQPVAEAYWRTLLGDRIPTTRPAPTEYGECYGFCEEFFQLYENLSQQPQFLNSCTPQDPDRNQKARQFLFA